MSSRWKKVWADFWGNPTRTILTVITIAVGTFAVGMNNNMALYMLESMDGDFLSANPSEATIYTSPLDKELVELGWSVPGVEAVEGRSAESARMARPEGEPVSIQFTAIERPEDLKLNRLKPDAGGKEIASPGERQVILDASAKSLGYKPGDKLTILLQDGRKRHLTLAGYVHDVTGFPYNLTQLINAYVTPETMEWLGGSRDFNALEVSVSEKQTDQEHVTQVSQAVSDRLEKAGVTVYYVRIYQPGHHFAWNITQGMFFVLGILGYLTVFLSAFLVINTITALMTQQTRQIGIMKAIGGGIGQVFGMYIVLILAFGLLALAIAIPLANLAAENIGGGMAAYLNFQPEPFKPYTQTLILQAVVALVVPLLAAVWPIMNSVRVTVREALSDYGIGGNVKPKDKSVNKSALLIPRPMRLSLRNAFRKKARLTLTLITLVLGGAIFIGVYNLWGTLDKTIEDIQGYILADINIPFGRAYRFEEVASIARSVPGVSSVEGWGEYPGTLLPEGDNPDTQVMFIAPPSTSTLIDPLITSGRWLASGDENAVVIGNHLLNIFPNLKVGDWMTIEIDGKKTRWQIVGVYSIAGNVTPPLLYVNYEYLSRVIGTPGQAYSVRVLTEQHDAATQKRIGQLIKAEYEERGIQLGTIELGADFVNSQKSQTDILVYFLLVMATLIAAVGGLGLMGTMSINVLERTREIGVMRAIGASNGDIQSIVIVEGMVIGVISWVLSIALSIPITAVLTYGVGMAVLTAPMAPVYGFTGIIAWLLFTLFLAAVASSIPARRASRLTVRDTLAYE